MTLSGLARSTMRRHRRIKIGWTEHFGDRLRWLKSYDLR